jgi:predicted ribosomally synthesized peptide with nif11-like leader
MSLQRARNFLTRVSQNHRLQTQLEAAAWDSRTAVGIGSALGYQFTPTDLQSAIDETWGVLTEEELLGVAGGGGNGRGGGGAVTVDTGTTDDGATSGETYTPPPGDVSGNSCFFSRTKSR